MTQDQRPTPADTARQLREIAAGADGECWGPWEDVSEILLEAAALLTASEREERFPLNPTKAMIEAGAQRLVRWEDGCEWPGSWSSLDVRAARNDAERVWRSMWLAANEAAPREKPPSPSPVPLGNWPKEVG